MVVLPTKSVKFSVKEERSLDVRYTGAATFRGGVKVVVEGLRGYRGRGGREGGTEGYIYIGPC